MEVKPAFKSERGRLEILAKYEQILLNWPVPYEEINIVTRHGKTYILASGEASLPPLFLLHGSGSNSSMWVGDVAEYSKYFRVYAIDIPGDPGKSEEKQYPLKSTAYFEWLFDVITSLQLERVTLLGISLGGWMALNFATKRPEMVEKIVLISPSGIGSQKASFLFKALLYMLLGEKGVTKIARMVVGDQLIAEEAIEYMKIINSHSNSRIETVPIFSDKELSLLTMPVMLIVGEKDVMLHSKESADRLAKLLPHATVNLIPNLGHVLLNLTGDILVFLQKKSK